jgi:hypothetical protein
VQNKLTAQAKQKWQDSHGYIHARIWH